MSTGFEPRRGGGAVATFTGFEADLLRSLASQLVELLRNEMAAPHESTDPFEQMMDFTGPTTEPDDPVLARLFPTAYPDDDPRTHVHDIYEWVGYLQETLVEALAA